MTDFGPKPYVMNIEKATLENTNYRTTLWTGQEMQLTVMSIQPGHDIGLEKHDDHDQFIRIEEGSARVQMGPAEDDLSFDVTASDDDAIFIPAGNFHNVTNIGEGDLKLYSIYAPAEHEHGTIHVTYEEAMEAEEHHHH